MATVSIPLTQGKFAIIDADDLPLVDGHRWYAMRNRNSYYAVRKIGAGRERRKLWLHRVILDAPEGVQVDHINGDGLDNRRANLRVCTNQQNSWNRHNTWGTSRYLGVSWDTARERWAATITVSGKLIRLGLFTDEEEAARARDAGALELVGPFARLNFPQS